MRTAYALMGLAWLIIIAAGVYGLNHAFTHSSDNAKTITNSGISTMGPSFSLNSSAFENDEKIPSQFTCDGAQVSPPLSISGVPASAKSLVLIMDDPDVPVALKPDLPAQAGGVFDHWILFNIPPDTTEIQQGGSVGTAGNNGAGTAAYTAPCPPKEYEPSEHHYVFTLYALDSEIPLTAGASKKDILAAAEGHIISTVQLIGRYKRQ